MADFFLKYKWRYFWGIMWLLVVDALQLVIPRLLGKITDGLASQSLGGKDIAYFSLLIIGVYIIIAVCRFLWRMYVMGTARLLEYSLRKKLFGHLQTLSTNYFNNHKTGDLMAHATNDINAVRMALGPGVVMLTDAIFLTIATITIMIRTIDLRLTLLALIPLPFLAFVVTSFGKIIHSRFKTVQEAFSSLTDRVQENIAGIRVVKAFVQEKEEINKFTQSNQHNVNMNLHLVRIWGAFFPLIQYISAIGFMIVLGYGGILVIYGTISLGDFVAFNSYLALLTWPMMALGWVINMMQRGAASMDRINKIFEESPEIVDKEDVVDLIEPRGEIKINSLTFSYPNSNVPALKNVSLKIKPGEKIAIIGKTGSGKTTLVNLLLRLYNVEDNSIFIDNIDINNISLKSLRESIGYVPQDNFLFSTTVKENIAFALDNYEMSEVEKYSKIAQVYDNIIDFPEQFETVLGERGVTLSGGQKQRVSIARALIKEPRVLILDDSLSAVDTNTEEEIQRGLKDYLHNRTSIVIAHRVSTIKDADQIIVLDEGSIAEEGNHESLLQLRGLYYNLYQKQLLEEKLQNH